MWFVQWGVYAVIVTIEVKQVRYCAEEARDGNVAKSEIREMCWLTIIS